MPNWCENRVCFKHSDPTKLAELDTALRDGKALQYLHPMPNELEGTTAPSDTPNWYDWCVNNWGTKWDMCDKFTAEIDEGWAEFGFNTAWGPPQGIYEKITEDFPDVGISWFYDEPGMEFAGYLPN